MNENSNYNFDPITGQPIQQQSIQNQTVDILSKQLETKNKSKHKYKMLILIITLVIVGIIVGIVLFNIINNNGSSENADVNSNNLQNRGNLEIDSRGTVDENINKEKNEDGAFLMAIEDVFTIVDLGTVVTGRISRGTVRVGDPIQIIGMNHEIRSSRVAGLQMFRKEIQEAQIGDNVGVVLENISRQDVERGLVLAQPNSIIAGKKFDADITIKSIDIDEKNTLLGDNSKLKFNFRTIDITGNVMFAKNNNTVNIGDQLSLTVNLDKSVAMEVGTEFSIKENRELIATGIITKVY